jgi:hypothetical protein
MKSASHLKSVFQALACALLLALGGAGASAQTNLGSLSGTVQDASGAVVPNAAVTVTDVGTNRSFKLTTSESGAYSLPNLEPVVYRVRAEATGFRPTVVEGVKVDTASAATVNVTLEVGAATETVNVTAEAALINAESGAQSETLTQRMIQDLPVANRNVLELALTVPNVSGVVGSEDLEFTVGTASPGAGLNINGGRPGESAILADGVTNTGASIARQVVSFSPDVVQEVTVQTSSFSAEYGRTGGGIINTTTKSGTNQFNGLASWFNRNPAFNAKDYNPGGRIANRDALRENRGTFTFGGPVWLPKKIFGPLGYDGRDKTFFFASFEPRWRSDGETQHFLVPDEGMRRGDFSNVVLVPGGYVRRDVAAKLGVAPTGDYVIYRQFNLDASGKQLSRLTLAPGQTFPQFANNVIPQNFLDPVSQEILKYMPQGGDYYLFNGQVRNYVGDRHVITNEKRYSVRIDHSLTNNNRLNLRYTTVPIFGERGRGAQEVVVNSRVSDYSASKQLLLSDTHTFSPTLINTLNLNYTRGFYDRTAPKIWQTRNFSTELGLPSGTDWGLPRFDTGPFTIGNGDSLNNATVGLIKNQEETYNINNVLSKISGSMTWKFGANLEQQQMSNSHIGTFQGGQYQFNAVHTNSALTNGTGGDTFASFLLGIPNAVDLRTSVVSYKYLWRSMDFFVQNDWKIRPNLTLNLGLRYSLELPRIERDDLQGSYDLERSERVPVPAAAAAAIRAAYPTFPVELLPKETMVPAFSFTGRGGRSRHLQPTDWNNFMPRVGFAWSPRVFGYNEAGGRSLVVRGGYGVSYLPLRGDNRRPVPDLGGQTAAGYAAATSGVDPNYFVRLGSNVPRYQVTNPLLAIPASGLVTTDSLALSIADSFAVSPLYQIPFTHNWSLATEFNVARDTTVELAYQGNYSNTLFFPPTSLNPAPFSYTEALQTANLDPNATTPDPLGRRDAQGRVINVRLGTLLSPFLGFQAINERYRADSRNFRNAGTVYLKRRLSRGLNGTAAYTFGKTLNDSSDAGTDNVGFSRTITQAGFGSDPRSEYSVADFDITHTFAGTFLYELPLGAGRRFLGRLPGAVDAAVGGWNVSGIFIANTGLPIRARLGDTNGLTGGSGSLRPNLNPNEPFLNPLWSRDCPFGEGCEPFANPAAFMRPVKGTVGNAPRTIAQARYPGRRQLDLSIQKDFYVFGKDSRRRLQFRVDAINALNTVNLRFDGNNAFNWSSGFPLETDISVTEYNNWVRANPQLGLALTPTASGATPTADYQKVLAITRGARGGRTAGPLPAAFFSVPLPQKFTTTLANSFDIRTEQGLKLYRLRNSFNAAEFGVISRAERMRVVTFALRLYF